MESFYNIPQLIDLALGTPEIGVVNFNILHALLHAMAAEIFNMESTQIQLVQKIDGKFETILVRKESSSQIIKKTFEGLKESQNESINPLPIDSVPSISEDNSISPKNTISDSPKNPTSDNANAEILETKILHERSVKDEKVSLHNIQIMTPKEDILDKNVDETAWRVKAGEDDNENNATDTTDPDLLNVKEDNNEIIENLKTNNQRILQQIDQFDLQIKAFEKTSGILYKEIAENKLFKEKYDIFDEFVKNEFVAVRDTINIKNDNFNSIYTELEKLRNESVNYKKEIMDLVSKGHHDVKTQKEFRPKPDTSVSNDKEQFVKQKFNTIDQQIFELNNRIMEFEKVVCVLEHRIGEPVVSQTRVDSNINIVDLHNELANIKKFTEMFKGDIEMVYQEQTDTRNGIAQFRKSLDDLKTSKIDKEEIDELLAEKADYKMLQRKVSTDLFDSDRRKMDKILNELKALTLEHDEALRIKFNGLTEEIKSKLGVNDLSSIKDGIDKKINLITEKIAGLGVTSTEPDAAGARLKILQNLHCISCDKYVSMRTQLKQFLPKQDYAYTTKSNKPSLIYNLEKQSKKNSDSRNMHHFEAMSKAYNKSLKNADVGSYRFCGGSHTKITNQDRLESGIGHQPKKKHPF